MDAMDTETGSSPARDARGTYGDRLASRLNYEALSRMAAVGLSDKEIAARIGIRSRIVAGLKSYYGLAGATRRSKTSSRP